DLDAMLAAITPKTRLIFIANPNNPTGVISDQRKIDMYMSRVPENIVTVFDEAYFEFIDRPPDTLRYVREGRNVVVLRTFSKIHALADVEHQRLTKRVVDEGRAYLEREFTAMKLRFVPAVANFIMIHVGDGAR